MLCIGAVGLSAPPEAPTSAEPAVDEKDIVVIGYRNPGEIVIDGRTLRCRRRPGDPLDAVDARPKSASRRQSVIMPDKKTGVLELVSEKDPILGPDIWQRAGTAIDHYTFRAPTDGTPMCIGSRVRVPQGWGQLRKILDARSFHGRKVRFTGWVAMRDAEDVRFWLAAGDNDYIFNGGNTNNQRFRGSYDWSPMMIEIGPISKKATKLSYGFLLHGAGDVWMHEPRIEIVPDDADDFRPDIVRVGLKRRGDD